MKIRNDFVTNSSSSSFILGFKPGEDIGKTIYRKYQGEYVCEAISEVEKHVLPDDKAEDAVREALEDFVFCELDDRIRKLCGKHGSGFNWMDENKEEYRQMKARLMEETCAGIMDGGYDRISIVEWEDHTDIGSAMEHEVFPRLPCTILQISHH